MKLLSLKHMGDVHKETKLQVCRKREYERDLGFEGANAKLNGRNHAHKGWHSLIMQGKCWLAIYPHT